MKFRYNIITSSVFEIEIEADSQLKADEKAQDYIDGNSDGSAYRVRNMKNEHGYVSLGEMKE